MFCFIKGMLMCDQVEGGKVDDDKVEDGKVDEELEVLARVGKQL